MNFSDAKQLFWFEYVNKTIPQDLQSLYKEDINKMKAGFIGGIEFMEKYFKLNIKNYDHGGPRKK